MTRFWHRPPKPPKPLSIEQIARLRTDEYYRLRAESQMIFTKDGAEPAREYFLRKMRESDCP